MQVERHASRSDQAVESSFAPSTRAGRALLGFTLGLAMCVGMLTTFALGVLAPFLTADLDASAGTIGALTGLLFLAGALVSPRIGLLVDRLGARQLLVLLFATTALAWTAMAAAPSVALLFPAIAIAGVGMALANPVTTRVALAQGGDHARLVGVAQAGSPLGSVLVGLVLPAAALALGWRGALLGLCTLCAVGLVVAARFGAHRPALHGTARGEATPRTHWLSTYALMMNTSSTAAIVYLPLYAYEDLGWSAQVAGLIAAVTGAVSMVGRLLWPRMVRRRAAVPWALEILAASAAASTVLVLIAGASRNSMLMWLAVTGLAGSAMSWVAVMMSAVAIEAGTAHAGRVAGVVMRYGFLGAALGPVVFGQIVETTGSWATAWATALVVFVVAGAGTVGWHRRRIALG